VKKKKVKSGNKKKIIKKTKKRKNVKKKITRKKTTKTKKFKKSKKTKKKKKIKEVSKSKKKKKVKRRKKKKIEMEDFYRLLNKVQVKKKTVVFAVELSLASVIENIIKDAGLKYNKNLMKTQCVFSIYPNQEEENYEILEAECLDDEIIEEGQIFP